MFFARFVLLAQPAMTKEDFIVWRQAILLVLNHYAKKYGVGEK